MRQWRMWLCSAGCAGVLLSLGACDREQLAPAAPGGSAHGAVRLALSADQTAGTIPLTVTFTGTLSGMIDTMLTRVPEISLAGGGTSDADLYMSLPDTLAAARLTYTVREHYFRAGSFKAVMRLHARGRDILSDTLVITVREG